MELPPIVSPQRCNAARAELLAKEKGLTRALRRQRPGDEAMGSTWSYLDPTALGRQEAWEDSPPGSPQTPPDRWWHVHDAYGDPA